MNALNVRSKWNEAKGKLKQKYSVLTDEDLTFSLGKEGELIKRLEQRLGMRKTEIFKVLAEL
jgi:uncharacterized protein YjbJ (UPF0337 family)